MIRNKINQNNNNKKISIQFVGFYFQSLPVPTLNFQHPSPLKEPILSSRTPKQLLSPPFLYRLHERLEVLMRSLKRRTSTPSLSARAELLGSDESQVRLNTNLSVFPIFSSGSTSSEKRSGVLFISSSKSCFILWWVNTAQRCKKHFHPFHSHIQSR